MSNLQLKAIEDKFNDMLAYIDEEPNIVSICFGLWSDHIPQVIRFKNKLGNIIGLVLYNCTRGCSSHKNVAGAVGWRAGKDIKLYNYHYIKNEKYDKKVLERMEKGDIRDDDLETSRGFGKIISMENGVQVDRKKKSSLKHSIIGLLSIYAGIYRFYYQIKKRNKTFAENVLEPIIDKMLDIAERSFKKDQYLLVHQIKELTKAGFLVGLNEAGDLRPLLEKEGVLILSKGKLQNTDTFFAAPIDVDVDEVQGICYRCTIKKNIDHYERIGMDLVHTVKETDVKVSVFVKIGDVGILLLHSFLNHNGVSISEYYLHALVDCVLERCSKFYLLGDFNTHWNIIYGMLNTKYNVTLLSDTTRRTHFPIGPADGYVDAIFKIEVIYI